MIENLVKWISLEEKYTLLLMSVYPHLPDTFERILCHLHDSFSPVPHHLLNFGNEKWELLFLNLRQKKYWKTYGNLTRLAEIPGSNVPIWADVLPNIRVSQSSSLILLWRRVVFIYYADFQKQIDKLKNCAVYVNSSRLSLLFES